MPLPYFAELSITVFLVGAGGYLLFVAINYLQAFGNGKTRKIVKWKDQKRKTKVIGVLTMASLVLGLYLTGASVLNMSGTSLPLGDLSGDFTQIPFALGLLGLAYVMRIQYLILKTRA